MDTKMGAAVSNTRIFEPRYDLIQEEECNTLLVYLPGFSKEQLRVQLDKAGFLKISGKRPLLDNKWSSFEKDFPVSSNCDTKMISAKFEGGILYVRQPKLIVEEVKEQSKLPPPSEIPHPQKPVNEPPPAPKKYQAQVNSQKAATNDGAKEFPEKSVQKEEPKNTKEKEKSNELEGAKNGERNSLQEKTGGKDDDLKSASKSSIDQRKNVLEATKQKVIEKFEGDKLNGASPAAKLKMARKTMNKVLVILLAFALGIYARDLIWRSDKP
ncbi:hypothetical protein ACJIZ3_012114 [Penstemon smallii]|uniref:SHSP domain-containing protein n=1 Tax=Penstemon smallii TaxID=265156 RepID=A0ABD3UL45_9LAMI